MKYIIVKELGCEVAILSNEIVSHSDLAAGNRNVVAAGFCVITPVVIKMETEYRSFDVQVYGESNTLKVKSRPEDADIIEHSLSFRS